MTTLPPDRSHLSTEQPHPASRELSRQDTLDALQLVIDDHRRVPLAVEAAAVPLASFIDDLALRMAAGGRLIYIGAGTSGRLGVLDASECPPTFGSSPDEVVGIIAGGDTALRRSSEGREDDPDGALPAFDELELGTNDVVLGIAAGGTTPYVRGGLRLAGARGATTGLLTCAPVTAPECDHVIVLDTGPELVTGSTRLKAGSATKLALNAITTLVFTRAGRVHGNRMIDLRATNEKLRDRAIRIVLEYAPALTREEAAVVLDAGGGHVLTAVVMHRRGVDRPTAERALAEVGEDLDAALNAEDDV